MSQSEASLYKGTATREGEHAAETPRIVRREIRFLALGWFPLCEL